MAFSTVPSLVEEDIFREIAVAKNEPKQGCSCAQWPVEGPEALDPKISKSARRAA